jgi:DNA gyrase inhibitor GyrI
MLTIDVLEPTLTTWFPVKDAVKMTIFAESPETAEIKASSVDTLVVVPPAPPVVLNKELVKFSRLYEGPYPPAAA